MRLVWKCCLRVDEKRTEGAAMNVTTSPHWLESGGEDRFTLFLAAARRRWILFGAVVVLSVAAAIALSFLMPSYWRAEITVMPVTASNGVNVNSALSSGLANLGGLGALLGRPASNQDEALAVLRSRALFDTYATQTDLLPVLYDTKWDAATKAWTVPVSEQPTLRQAFRLFDQTIRDIELDRRSGIVTLSITWKDRVLAAKWARDLIDLTNSQLRQRAMTDARRNMAFLSEQIKISGQGGAQNALTAALAASYDRELQNYMSASGQHDFAFRVIDAPTVPDLRERVSPNRVMIGAIGMVAGILLGCLVVWWAERRRSYGLAQTA
jgi:uncharacterized protein involved in exopolysaccharide biosynthesis